MSMYFYCAIYMYYSRFLDSKILFIFSSIWLLFYDGVKKSRLSCNLTSLLFCKEQDCTSSDERKFWLRDHFRAIFIPATWFRRLILTICSRKWFNLTKFTRYQNLLCSAPLSEIPKKVWILSIRKEYNFMLFYKLVINCLYMYFIVF